jgi:hypothetical protein
VLFFGRSSIDHGSSDPAADQKYRDRSFGSATQ